MAVVSQDVADGLRTGEPERIAMFTASCAERMAQLFTGLRGDDPGRAGDVEILLEVLDELWDIRLVGSAFTARVGQLERFVEVVRADDGEQLNTAVDTYAFYALLSASRNVCNGCAKTLREESGRMMGLVYAGNGKTTTRQRSFEWPW